MNTPPLPAPPDYWPEEFWKEETELEEGWVPKTTHAEHIEGWRMCRCVPIPLPIKSHTATGSRIRDGPSWPSFTSLGEIPRTSYL